MNSIQILEVSYYVVMVLCWLLSLTLYFRRAVPRYLMLFPPYMFMTLIMAMVAYWMATRWGNNHILLNIYTTAAFAFFFYIFLLLLQRNRLRTVLLYLDCLFLLFATAYFCLVDVRLFNPFLFMTGAIFILFHCFIYLKQLFSARLPVPIYKEPSFWICCSLLCLYGGMMTLLHANHFLHIFPRSMLNAIVALVYLTNDISYLLLSISFLCVGYTGKPAK